MAHEPSADAQASHHGEPLKRTRTKKVAAATARVRLAGSPPSIASKAEERLATTAANEAPKTKGRAAFRGSRVRSAAAKPWRRASATASAAKPRPRHESASGIAKPPHRSPAAMATATMVASTGT